MAMNRSGNREFQDDDEQRMLQDALGGVQTRPDSPLQAQPVGGMTRQDKAQQAVGVLEQSGGGDRLRDIFDIEKPSMPRVGPVDMPELVSDKPGAELGPVMAGGAMARYGTGNIPGAENIASGGHMGALTGFNTGGWGTQERGTNSIKNTFGKIASRYDPTQPGAVRQILADPEFSQFFPEAKLVEHPKGDLIDFGDGNPVDVLRNAVEGGSGDAWQFLAGGGAQGAPMAAGMGGGLDLSALQGGGEQANLATESDVLAQILGELQAAQGGGAPDEQQMLQSLLTEL